MRKKEKDGLTIRQHDLKAPDPSSDNHAQHNGHDSSSVRDLPAPPPGAYPSWCGECYGDEMLREAAPEYDYSKRKYTIKDIELFPEHVRAQIVDGEIFFMQMPTRTHQKINGEMHVRVANYIREKGGPCEVYIPPFAVYFPDDDSTYFEPDLTVICDQDKLDEKGCHGAPDWIVEISSPSTRKLDYTKKLVKYRKYGVREYWIVNPQNRTVTVFIFDKGNPEMFDDTSIYSFDDEIQSYIYPDLKIRLSDTV